MRARFSCLDDPTRESFRSRALPAACVWRITVGIPDPETAFASTVHYQAKEDVVWKAGGHLLTFNIEFQLLSEVPLCNHFPNFYFFQDHLDRSA